MRFSQLKHKLLDHAEDFQKTTAKRTNQAGLSADVRSSKMKKADEVAGNGRSHDSSSMIQEHLQQQDGQLVALDLQLGAQEAELKILSAHVQQLVGLFSHLVEKKQL